MVSDRLYKILAECRRRGVVGVLVLYVVGGWVGLQVAATLFPGWRIPDEAIRFVWSAAVALLPVVFVFGWRYDLTKHGIRRTAAASDASANLPLNKRDYVWLTVLSVAATAVLSLAVVRIADTRSGTSPIAVTRAVPPNSVAVLPFVNMSDNETDDYFSDGITEQLLNELARIPGLHVAARTSSFYFKDRNELLHEIGRQLGVRTLLEGSVRRAGDTVRITAQLINASDGYHIWSDTYERSLDDVFLVQDEIATAIAGTLRIELLGVEQDQAGRVMTDDVDAFDLYLRAMATRRNGSPDTLDESIDMLADVIAMDDGFAEAYDALAYGYLVKSYNGTMSADEAASRAQPLLERALELRPDMEQALASMGLLNARLARYEEANTLYERALAINPNYFGGQLNYGFSLVIQGRLKDGSEAYLRAQSLDPLNSSLNFNLGALMMLLGNVDSGLKFMRRALEIDPELGIVKGAITHWLGVYGRLDEAVRHGERVLQSDVNHLWNARALARTYVDLGMVESASALLDDFEQRFPGNETIATGKFDLLLATGDDDALYSSAEAGYRSLDLNVGDPLSANENDRVYRFAIASLVRGDNEVAAEHLLWSAGGEDGLATKTYDEMEVLKMLALAYRRLGRAEESALLLDQSLALAAGAAENGWDTPSLHVRVAEIHAVRGDAESAVRNLEKAIDKGWRRLSDIEYGIFWRDLQDDTGLNQVKVKILEDLSRQRDALAADGFGAA